MRSFSEADPKREGFCRFYVEAGGGVWETIRPIFAARERGRTALSPIVLVRDGLRRDEPTTLITEVRRHGG